VDLCLFASTADTEELERRLAADPSLKAAFAAELARVLERQPDSGRALALSQVLTRISHQSPAARPNTP